LAAPARSRFTSDHIGYPNSGGLFDGLPLAGRPIRDRLEWSEVNSKQIKFASATLGASAVVAMGAFGAASSDTSAADSPPPGPVTTSEVTTGETITETPAPESPPATVATPEITTTPTSAEPG